VLRALVLALVLANAGYFAWTQGWLDTFTGQRAGSQREPDRLARQLRPESVLILSPSSALPPITSPVASAVSSSVAGACLEAGPFSAAEADAAASAVQAALRPGSWADVKTDRPGSWLVYMGRYPDRELLAKKKEEIARIKLAFEDVRSPPSLDPGLSLGRFDDRAGAEEALAQLALRGVKSARVVELAPASSSHMLRVDAADEALVRQLGELKSAALGKGFAPCAKVAAN
jgi:hypothetical protein